MCLGFFICNKGPSLPRACSALPPSAVTVGGHRRARAPAPTHTQSSLPACGQPQLSEREPCRHSALQGPPHITTSRSHIVHLEHDTKRSSQAELKLGVVRRQGGLRRGTKPVREPNSYLPTFVVMVPQDPRGELFGIVITSGVQQAASLKKISGHPWIGKRFFDSFLLSLVSVVVSSTATPRGIRPRTYPHSCDSSRRSSCVCMSLCISWPSDSTRINVRR